MPISAFIRTPLTDLTGNICTHQYFSPCAELERKTMVCFETYGMDRSYKLPKCVDIIDDFKECVKRSKQLGRVREMRSERFRQYYNNERSKEELYAPGPRVDVYQ